MKLQALRAAAISMYPYFNDCIFQSEISEECTKRGGLNFQLFDGVARLVGYTNITYIKAPNYEHLLNLLNSGEIDVAASPVFLDGATNLSQISVSHVVDVGDRVFVLKKPQENPNFDLFPGPLKPFSYETWLLLALIYGISFFFQPRCYSTSSKILSTVLAVRILFFLRIYKTQFYSSLLLNQRPQVPFTDLESFASRLETGDIHYITEYPRTATLKLIRNSKGPPFPRIWRILRSSNPLIIASDFIHQISFNEKYTTAFTKSTYLYHSRGFCNLTTVPMLESRFAFAFPWKSPLVEKFNLVLYPEHSSIVEIAAFIRSKYIPSKECAEDKATNDKAPISLRQFRADLLQLLGLLSICALAFVGEMLFANCLPNRRKQFSLVAESDRLLH